MENKNKIQEWQLREEHDNAIKSAMQETGVSFRKWNGDKFWKVAKKVGHTSLDFDKCTCRKISPNF